MDNKKNKVKSFAIDTVKGITLGISVAIPGLSAGTIAVSEKCYDTIVDATSTLRTETKKKIMILLPYVIGLIVGALGAFIGIQRGYEAAPFSLTGLFAGLVIGSLPVAIQELRKGENAKEKLFHIGSLVLALVIAAGLGVITALALDENGLSTYLNDRVWWMYIFVIVAGFIAAFACVVPGISGSMTMMIMGMYYPVLNTYTGENAIWHSGSGYTIGTGFALALLLAIGILLGLLAAAKSMKYLLSKHRVTTFYAIVGLIIGSVISMYMNSSIYPLYPTISTWDYITGAILFVIASGVVLFITLPKRKKVEEETEEKTVEEQKTESENAE